MMMMMIMMTLMNITDICITFNILEIQNVLVQIQVQHYLTMKYLYN